MADFSKGGGARTPFGKNQYLRSTKVKLTESYTFAKGAIPTVTIDGETQKVLQPGTVLAEITAAGADQGKVGVFDDAATDGRQTAANIVGICDTFAPWQLLERDIEVAAVYAASVVQSWCIEYESGIAVALDNTTRDAIKALPKFDGLIFYAA